MSFQPSNVIFDYYGLGVSRPECEKLKFNPSLQLN